jgi:hypothetical protein
VPGGKSRAAESTSSLKDRAASTAIDAAASLGCPSGEASAAPYQNRKPRSAVRAVVRDRSRAVTSSAARRYPVSPVATAVSRSMPPQKPPNHPPSSDHVQSPETGSAYIGNRWELRRSVSATLVTSVGTHDRFILTS